MECKLLFIVHHLSEMYVSFANAWAPDLEYRHPYILTSMHTHTLLTKLCRYIIIKLVVSYNICVDLDAVIQ